MGCLWPAAVKALSMAMEMEVSFAVGWRMKCRRWRVESTIAMLKSVIQKGKVSRLMWTAVFSFLQGSIEVIPMPIS